MSRKKYKTISNEKSSASAPVQYFGEPGIDYDLEVVRQIETAASIPVAVKAAVLPDAHVGYALPIGGVIALENAVSPHFVGFDIACRMTMTILDIGPDELIKNRNQIASDMKAVSCFGVGAHFSDNKKRDHGVLSEKLWHEIPLLKSLFPKAHEQLGTSGGGNHFFDAVTGIVRKETAWLPLKTGTEFAAIITHSGSRHPGHQVATYYSQLAKEFGRKHFKNIASGYEWLPADSEAGLEYWLAMELMGKYARANHHLIHDYFLKQSGISGLIRYENHHNFAWKEGGKIIHRKGATPAARGDIGIIPGSMGTSSFLVEGLGNLGSLNSSSHGAGRKLSRTQAFKVHNENEYRTFLREHDILVSGVKKDETYQVYKDIQRVMKLQSGILTDIVAEMKPRIVIMGDKADDGD